MNPKIFTGIIALFGTGLIGGYVLHDIFGTEAESTDTTSKQVRQIGSYTYINPLLECEVAEGTIDAYKENFSGALDKFVEQQKRENDLADIAVYFRDMNNGPAFGVNEDRGFFPASLLKVPIMMTYYRAAERDPSLLGMVVKFRDPGPIGTTKQLIKPEEGLIPGESYTVDELIRRMIIYSDNQAAFILANSLPVENFQDLFKVLGLGEDVLSNQNIKLSVKQYASFFRILFNSSFLSAEFSEKALSVLAETKYRDALVAGVAEGVAVAHKFGEVEAGEEYQFHDCGIVYFPDHPYLACIMTRGRDVNGLKESITAVSKFIYEKIDEQY